MDGNTTILITRVRYTRTSEAKRISVPVTWYVKPILWLETGAYESTSVTRHQIELLSNFNAHV